MARGRQSETVPRGNLAFFCIDYDVVIGHRRGHTFQLRTGHKSDIDGFIHPDLFRSKFLPGVTVGRDQSRDGIVFSSQLHPVGRHQSISVGNVRLPESRPADFLRRFTGRQSQDESAAPLRWQQQHRGLN